MTIMNFIPSSRHGNPRLHSRIDLISIVFRLAMIVFAASIPLSGSQAQESILIGTWQRHGVDKAGVAYVFTEIFSPDGNYLSEFAVGSGPSGSGSGVTRTRGTYRMEGPTTVQITYGDSVICPAGVGCVPAAPGVAWSPGTSKSYNFQPQGNDRILTEDGTVAFRVR
jgi:hypothetical protein